MCHNFYIVDIKFKDEDPYKDEYSLEDYIVHENVKFPQGCRNRLYSFLIVASIFGSLMTYSYYSNTKVKKEIIPIIQQDSTYQTIDTLTNSYLKN